MSRRTDRPFKHRGSGLDLRFPDPVPRSTAIYNPFYCFERKLGREHSHRPRQVLGTLQPQTNARLRDTTVDEWVRTDGIAAKHRDCAAPRCPEQREVTPWPTTRAVVVAERNRVTARRDIPTPRRPHSPIFGLRNYLHFPSAKALRHSRLPVRVSTSVE